MTWKEFLMFLSGLGAETPLVKMVSIRATNDPEVLKQFTPEQRRIRDEWQLRRFNKKPKAERDRELNDLIQGLISMAQ